MLNDRGFSVQYVQEWMAHSSVEMTLTYARLLEEAKTADWTRAMADGAVKLDAPGGTPQIVDADALIDSDTLDLAYVRRNLEATRVEAGYCFRPVTVGCDFAEIACYTWHNWVTTRDFLPQFRKMEADLVFQIELGTRAGNQNWIVKNEKKLAAIRAVIATLEQQEVHSQMTKREREYGPGEAGRPAQGTARPVTS